MTTQAPTPAPSQEKGWRPGAVEALLVILLVLLLGQHWLTELFSSPAWSAGATIFVSIVVQATPFLVLGVVLSGVIAAYVPPDFFARALPKNPALASTALLDSIGPAHSAEELRLQPHGARSCTGRGARVPAVEPGDQPRGDRVDVRGLPQQPRDGAGALRGVARDRGGDGLVVAALRPGRRPRNWRRR